MTDTALISAKQPLLACISADPADAILLADLARITECQFAGNWGWPQPESAGADDDLPRPDIIYADLGSEMELSGSSALELIRYCHQIGAKMVVSTDLECLDRRLGELPLEECQIVIGKQPAELVLALGMARGRRTMDRVFDPARQYEAEALDRISSELASYARTLSRIARAEAEGEIAPDHIADKAVAYRGPPPSPFLPSGAGEDEAALDPADIRELIRLRRLRDRFFAPELFADPAWDILLDLMAARLEGQKVSVSSLCIAAAVPATTALRWIKSMTDAGYLERRSDPTDARRVYICLSEETARKMTEYIRQRLMALRR